MSRGNWRDWVWPTLNPLPDTYYQMHIDELETMLSKKTARLKGRHRAAKIWAEEELRELIFEQERNYRQSQKVEFYRNVSLTSLSVPLVALLFSVFSNGFFRPTTLIQWITGSVLLVSFLYISANAHIAFLAAYRALNPGNYPSGPSQVLTTRIRGDLEIAAERARTNLKWSFITNKIISKRKLAIRAMKNVVFGTLFFLLSVVMYGVSMNTNNSDREYRSATQTSGISSTCGDSACRIFSFSHGNIDQQSNPSSTMFSLELNIDCSTSTSVMIDTSLVPSVQMNTRIE